MTEFIACDDLSDLRDNKELVATRLVELSNRFEKRIKLARSLGIQGSITLTADSTEALIAFLRVAADHSRLQATMIGKQTELLERVTAQSSKRRPWYRVLGAAIDAFLFAMIFALPFIFLRGCA